MTQTGVSNGDAFQIGGELEVARLGFGALRVVGPTLWGEPADRPAAISLLRRVVQLGVNLIDTADSYGPETSEKLIREALHPYPAGLVIATKGGFVRPDAGTWVELGRPEYLIHTAKLSARRLGLDTIPLWQLHRIDPKVPRDEQFGALKQLRDEGVVRHIGLSEVGVEEIEAARAYFPVATVQNNFSIANRRYEPVLEYCEAHGIGFMAFFPLGRGTLAQQSSPLAVVASRHGATPAQIALAWLLKRSPVLLPIPGTASPQHLEENVAAARIELSDEDFASIDTEGRTPAPG
jgi:aryl-alcohol dehydrogenase-like predicted oxidoreductase